MGARVKVRDGVTPAYGWGSARGAIGASHSLTDRTSSTLETHTRHGVALNMQLPNAFSTLICYAAVAASHSSQQ